MGLWTPEQEKIEQARDSAAGRHRTGDSIRKVFVFSALAAFVAILTWMLRPADPVYEITLDATATIIGSQMIVSGTTNLLDGSILQYRLTTPEGETIKGTTTVDGEEFEVIVSPVVTGDLELVLVFEIVMPDRIQEVGIVEHYGGFGEHLGGEHVERDERGKHLRREMTLNFD